MKSSIWLTQLMNMLSNNLKNSMAKKLKNCTKEGLDLGDDEKEKFEE